VYRSGDQILAASYTVKGDTFVAEKPQVWIAKSGMGVAAGIAAWDLARNLKSEFLKSQNGVYTPITFIVPLSS